MMNNSTEHTHTDCVMCSAIAAAKAVVEQTRKEDSAIPVILRALGWEKSPNPWPAAVRALKDHAQSMALTAELQAHLDLVASHDAWLAEYERHMKVVSEPNSAARKQMQKLLVSRESEYRNELRKLADQSNEAVKKIQETLQQVNGAIAEINQSIETTGAISEEQAATTEEIAAILRQVHENMKNLENFVERYK